MPRTAQNYVDLMAHRLGKTPDPRHNLFDTFNDAGRHLFLEAPWLWRGENSRQIPTVADQEYVMLPGDFHSVVHITSLPTGLYPIQQVTLDHIMNLRRNSLPLASLAGGMYVSVRAWRTQSTVDTQPTQRMELYPTPVSDASPTFVLTYNRTWKEIPAADPSALPNIPPEAENALVNLSRAFALGRENEPDMAAGDYALYQRDLAMLSKSDGFRQVRIGPIRGGAAEYGPPPLFQWRMTSS